MVVSHVHNVNLRVASLKIRVDLFYFKSPWDCGLSNLGTSSSQKSFYVAKMLIVATFARMNSTHSIPTFHLLPPILC